MMPLSFFALLYALQTLVALITDFLIGDPRWLPHPVRGVGWLIVRMESFLRPRFADLRVAGAVLCALVTLAAATLALALAALLIYCDTRVLPAGVQWFTAGWRSVPWFSVLGGGLFGGILLAWRSLGSEALGIHALLQAGRKADARAALALIVGRDTQQLEEPAMIRAVIETVGENTVDGAIAPVFYALLGGPVLVAFFKAASTLDSMIGHRNARYRELGLVAARLDDALNYIPARLALVLVPLAAALAGLDPRSAFRIGRRDHSRHPSPNSAWSESCFAGALGVQLGGAATYENIPVERPLLGDPRRPLARHDILRATRLLFSVAGLTFLIILSGIIALWSRMSG